MVGDSTSTKTQLGSLFVVLLITVFCLGPFGSLAQVLQKFNYGGNGKRFGGSFTVGYFIESENQKHRLEKPDEINLNSYPGKVKFLIQVSDLKLGYNKSFTKVKYQDHPKVFYIELIKSQHSEKNLSAIWGDDTVKMSPETGHYGAKTSHLAFAIDQIKEKTTLTFGITTRVIDGIYDRSWPGITVTKEILVIPRTDSDSTIANQNVRKSRKRKSQYAPLSKPGHQADTLLDPPTIEDKLWAKIEQDFLNDDKKSLLARCRLYRINCNQLVFTSCKYMEDVLFFMINLVEMQEKTGLIEEYHEYFPSGKYTNAIENLLAKPEVTKTPIQSGLAKLDFDQRALMIYKIKGGNLPYYVGFYDYKINKEHAVKRIRFSKENLHLNLQSLDVPEGSYAVRIMDSLGQLFLEQDGIIVNKAYTIPNSIMLALLLVVTASLYLLYKRYIHF